MATKIVQDESRIKRKASGFSFFIPSRSLSRSKDSARREKGKMKNHVFQILLILA